MALGSALTTAKNSLRATSTQMDVVSQNVARVRDPNYTRRTTELVPGEGGALRVQVRREEDSYLLTHHMSKISHFSSAKIVAQGVARVAAIHDTNDYATSPAALLGIFRDSLLTYFNQHDQPGAGDAAITAGKNLVETLNYGNQELEKLRLEADKDIEAGVQHINDILTQFHEISGKIVQGTALGGDVDSLADQRDALLKELSQEMGVTSVTHSDGSMSLYGVDGSTLYDKSPRVISFETSTSLAAGVKGGMVYIDGVPLDHSSFISPNGSGTIGALLQMRDSVIPQYQAQLDEISHTLADMFKGPPALFLDGGDSLATGLSGRLSINPIFDSREGGSALALGDRDTITKLIDAFDVPRSYDPAAGITGKPTLIKFAEGSIAWLETLHKQSVGQAEYQQTMFVRTGEALSNQTGVNSDEEMAIMLQLEQSYAASARIISAIGKMLDELLSAVR